MFPFSENLLINLKFNSSINSEYSEVRAFSYSIFFNDSLSKDLQAVPAGAPDVSSGAQRAPWRAPAQPQLRLPTDAVQCRLSVTARC